MTDTEKIPFQIEIARVLDLLARQIYQDPLALLRENTQNAYDAVLIRRARDASFNAKIDIALRPRQVVVQDNGVGMTRKELRENYWTAGSSGKNNEAARQAGVVGTFGIGAMANFGIASKLVVETESLDGERTRCEVAREDLSVQEDCIELVKAQATGNPGTTVTAELEADSAINVDTATTYIRRFVRHVAAAVHVNGKLISQEDRRTGVWDGPVRWTTKHDAVDLRSGLRGDLEIRGSGKSGWPVAVLASNLIWKDEPLRGEVILSQALSQVETFRSGFGLATVSIGSHFGLGGLADLTALEPTAGRESLSTGSMQLLQSLVLGIEILAAEAVSGQADAESNAPFHRWLNAHGRYELAGRLKVRREPQLPEPQLSDLPRKGQPPLRLLSTANDRVIKAYASDDAPLLVLASANPRRRIQQQYIRRFCEVEEIAGEAKVLSVKTRVEYSHSESSLAFRVASVLASDYFLEANVQLGKVLHELPVFVEERPSGGVPIITLDPDAPTAAAILAVHGSEYAAFGALVKDFVRSMIFPRISTLVPTSTKVGAEAFLERLHKRRHVFEYGEDDLDDLSLTAIWEDYRDGKITLTEAAKLSRNITPQSVQVVAASATSTVSRAIPGLMENREIIQTTETDELAPAPAIMRSEMSAEARLLTIPAGERALNGFRCFLSISDRVREEHGDFFHHPHTTSVVWGGQKTLFIFQHHSSTFGLYYDLQMNGLISAESGGGGFATTTLVLENRIFVPVPQQIQAAFVPTNNETKRFDVRCDLLALEVGE